MPSLTEQQPQPQQPPVTFFVDGSDLRLGKEGDIVIPHQALVQRRHCIPQNGAGDGSSDGACTGTRIGQGVGDDDDDNNGRRNGQICRTSGVLVLVPVPILALVLVLVLAGPTPGDVGPTPRLSRPRLRFQQSAELFRF